MREDAGAAEVGAFRCGVYRKVRDDYHLSCKPRPFIEQAVLHEVESFYEIKMVETLPKQH